MKEESYEDLCEHFNFNLADVKITVTSNSIEFRAPHPIKPDTEIGIAMEGTDIPATSVKSFMDAAFYRTLQELRAQELGFKTHWGQIMFNDPYYNKNTGQKWCSECEQWFSKGYFKKHKVKCS